MLYLHVFAHVCVCMCACPCALCMCTCMHAGYTCEGGTTHPAAHVPPACPTRAHTLQRQADPHPLPCRLPWPLPWPLPATCSRSRQLDALKRYGRDFTEEARRGLLDPVIGRRQVMQRVMQVGVGWGGRRGGPGQGGGGRKRGAAEGGVLDPVLGRRQVTRLVMQM